MMISTFPRKVEVDKIRRDPLVYQGGVKAGTATSLMQGMGQLERNFASIKTPYIIIVGSKDQICWIEGTKVELYLTVFQILKLFAGILHCFWE